VDRCPRQGAEFFLKGRPIAPDSAREARKSPRLPVFLDQELPRTFGARSDVLVTETREPATQLGKELVFEFAFGHRE